MHGLIAGLGGRRGERPRHRRTRKDLVLSLGPGGSGKDRLLPPDNCLPLSSSFFVLTRVIIEHAWLQQPSNYFTRVRGQGREGVGWNEVCLSGRTPKSTIMHGGFHVFVAIARRRDLHRLKGVGNVFGSLGVGSTAARPQRGIDVRASLARVARSGAFAFGALGCFARCAVRCICSTRLPRRGARGRRTKSGGH